MISAIILFSTLSGARAIVGYDCGADGNHLNRLSITSIDLLDVGDCEGLKAPTIKTVATKIQVLEVHDFGSEVVNTCRVEVVRQITHCGALFSHASVVHNGLAQYTVDITRDECEIMHKLKIYEYAPEKVIRGLKVNETSSHPVVFAGSVSDAWCSGGSLTDTFGSWDNVVAQGILTVHLESYTAPVNMVKKQIILKSGRRCDYGSLECKDMDHGNAFWRATIESQCGSDKYYSVLFTGNGTKIIDEEDNSLTFAFEDQGRAFALRTTSMVPACSLHFHATEHPKLFVYEPAVTFIQMGKRLDAVENLDMFAYINSKFVYVSDHFRNQIKQLYQDIRFHRCRLEAEIFRNTQALSYSRPDEVAFNVMKGPGFTAIIAGEVLHIVKCTPVDVVVRQSKNCYNQLPVSWNNEPYFLAPKTRVLMKQGAKITCNKLVPPMFLIDNVWYRISPRMVETAAPIQLQSDSKITWKYREPKSLAVAGIYAVEELNRLRDYLLFPHEKFSGLNKIERAIAGDKTELKDTQVLSIMDVEYKAQNIVHTIRNVRWDKFMKFGTFSAGVISAVVVLSVIKLIFYVVIRAFILKQIFGVVLLAAISGCLTKLLVCLAGGMNNMEKWTTINYTKKCH